MSTTTEERFLDAGDRAARADGTRTSSLSSPRPARSLLVLVVVVGLVAVLIGGEFAASGVRAQIDARLSAAGAGVNAGLVTIEANALALVREISYTKGVAAALERRDANELNSLVTPMQVNSGIPMVDVVYPNGEVVFAVRSKGAPPPVRSRADLGAVAASAAGADAANGGRFSEIATLQGAPTLVTVGPLLYANAAIGVVLVMTPLADVLGQLASELNVTLTAYGRSGAPVATTYPTSPTRLSPATARSLVAGAAVDVRGVGSRREMLGRLVVDDRVAAVLGVSMSDDSFVTELVVDLAGAVGVLLVAALLTLSQRRREREP